MRVLKVGSSNAFAGDTPDELRTEAVSDVLMEAVTGERWETVVKSHTPSPTLPQAVERWLDRYQPDLVSIWPNVFFINYESVPLKLDRKFGRASKPVVAAGLVAGGNPWLNRRGWFHAARRGVKRVIGGVAYVEPESAVASYEGVILAVLRREGTGLVVGGLPAVGGADWMGLEQAEARRMQVHRGLRELCARAHVPYYGFERGCLAAEAPDLWDADRLHGNARALTLAAEIESYLLLEGWRLANPGAPLRATVEEVYMAWRQAGAGPVHFQIGDEELGRLHSALETGVIENILDGPAGGPPWIAQQRYRKQPGKQEDAERATPA